MVAYIMFILQAKLQWLVIKYAFLLAPRELKYVFKGISDLEACLVYVFIYLFITMQEEQKFDTTTAFPHTGIIRYYFFVGSYIAGIIKNY